MLFSLLVKHWLYAILGTFAELFPEHVISQSDRLVSMYINVLKSEVLQHPHIYCYVNVILLYYLSCC